MKALIDAVEKARQSMEKAVADLRMAQQAACHETAQAQLAQILLLEQIQPAVNIQNRLNDVETALKT